jgi:hypothetical protein
MNLPAAALAGRVFQPHFSIVPLGTTVSVTLATRALGKFPAAPVVSPFESPPNEGPESPHWADHPCFTPNR